MNLGLLLSSALLGFCWSLFKTHKHVQHEVPTIARQHQGVGRNILDVISLEHVLCQQAVHGEWHSGNPGESIIDSLKREGEEEYVHSKNRYTMWGSG